MWSDNTGVPGELYYCRNGVVNDYALSFNLPIKTDITEIYFSWVNDPPLGLQKPDITVSVHAYTGCDDVIISTVVATTPCYGG